ncbi:MAG: hypothetical protein NWF14_03850, partial [Candidatus Bathyarchaeota archaeon]|nr:hypothetical protein [Candidatus Bathyarchaeota archaeon]
LGVVVMLGPVVTFTYYRNTVATPTSQGQGGAEDSENWTCGGDTFSEAQDFSTIYRAAQTYGKTDAEPENSLLSLANATLLVTTGLAAALGVSLYFKRRVKLV